MSIYERLNDDLLAKLRDVIVDLMLVE